MRREDGWAARLVAFFFHPDKSWLCVLAQVLWWVLMRLEHVRTHTCTHSRAHVRNLPKQPGLLLGDVAPGAWQQKLLYSSHVWAATSSVAAAIGCFPGCTAAAWRPPRPPRPTSPHSVIFQKNQGFHLLSPWNSILSLSLLMILEPTAVIIFCPRTNKKVTWHLKANTRSCTHTHATLGKENIGTQTAK